MEINWQNVFYITASLAMIAVFVTCIWLMWLLFIVSKLINRLAAVAHRLSDISGDINYFRNDIMPKISLFLSKILSKGGEKK